jgi:uncharacterized protein YndB with AHSA1/START domain
VTEVNFSDHASGGTLMEVVQTYSLAAPGQAEQMVKGAPEGWRQTLDKLEREVQRLQGGAVRSVVHGAFHIERAYDATAEEVYRALSEEAAKSRWFVGPSGWRLIERVMDFRVGGRERVKGRHESGVVTTFDAVYHDIVPRERIVYTYEMRVDDRKISVSLATLRSSRPASAQPSFWSTSKGRSSTATTMRAHANAGRAIFSTSSARRCGREAPALDRYGGFGHRNRVHLIRRGPPAGQNLW